MSFNYISYSIYKRIFLSDRFYSLAIDNQRVQKLIPVYMNINWKNYTWCSFKYNYVFVFIICERKKRNIIYRPISATT